ncbi:uncharacterized protein LOC132201074 [Neocloeon triangulifer]|uniref:uncharacterized protein LOC132201074 n=1 Tax=Neocloeon triangulifer TaxID=2078957 RepID=UPI00286ED647|nr:uncharacterized protein LOC132201074 [Neocloeon triangulifer]
MGFWSVVVFCFLSCIATGESHPRVGTGCKIRHSIRSTEIMYEASRFYDDSVAIWNYGDSKVGPEAIWEIEEWQVDGRKYYEFHNPYYDNFMAYKTGHIHTYKKSYFDSREANNLFQIEPPSFKGENRVSIISKGSGKAAMVTQEAPNGPRKRTFVRFEASNPDSGWQKWEILCD